jgi:hypothetical protein
MPGLDNRKSSVSRSRAGQISIRTKDLINGNAGYSSAGACLTPKRDKDRTSQQQVLTTAKYEVRTLPGCQTTSYCYYLIENGALVTIAHTEMSIKNK